MIKDFNGIRVIGVGGIGTALLTPLCRYVTYSYKASDPIDITLIDGDKFEAKNLERQGCSIEDIEVNKSDAMRDKLSAEFDALDINSFPHYLNATNISEVIKNGDLVFMGVDNHKTRKIVSDYCATLDDIVLVSGGNEYHDGNIQLFIRENGKPITASLDAYHPEIASPKDKSPDELGCAELMASAPQLLFMNLAIASLMLNAMYVVMTEENHHEVYGEVYVDIKEATSLPSKRKPRLV